MTWATGKSYRAFTLIELLLVLTLLAAVLAIAMPSLSGYSRRLTQQRMVDVVRNSLLQTRRLAIERGELVRWEVLQVRAALPDLQIQVSPTGPIEFLPSGVCSDATVQLQDERNAVFAILACSGATGNILSLAHP